MVSVGVEVAAEEVVAVSVVAAASKVAEPSRPQHKVKGVKPKTPGKGGPMPRGQLTSLQSNGAGATGFLEKKLTGVKSPGRAHGRSISNLEIEILTSLKILTNSI